MLLVTLAGCAGGTIGVGGFSGGGGGGVGVGVSAPVGGSGGQGSYVVSEGEQVIQPGMASSEVIQRLGYPYYRFGVRQDNATIWNYRMRYGSCLIYQVSILPDGIVKGAGTAPDPACGLLVDVGRRHQHADVSPAPRDGGLVRSRVGGSTGVSPRRSQCACCFRMIASLSR